MRNWNSDIWLRHLFPFTSFVAYLWGIETIQYMFVHCFVVLVRSLPMRNWNACVFDSFATGCGVFVAYLWGIETSRLSLLRRNRRMFVAYLWGIETYLVSKAYYSTYAFVAYLWGIETSSQGERGSTVHSRVRSLPMRNWNLCKFFPWGLRWEPRS